MDAINASIQGAINTEIQKNNHGRCRLIKGNVKNSEDKIDYHEMLLARGLSKYGVQGLPLYRKLLNKAHKFVDQKITVSIGKQNIIGLVILFSIARTVLSILIPLSRNNTHRIEEKVITINTDKSIPQKEEMIKKEKINPTSYFNFLVFDGDVFRNLILFSAFILAFFRWHVGNRQSAMSEIFERKRSMNLHIINNESDIKDMI